MVSISVIRYSLRHSWRQAPRCADVLVCRRLIWHLPLWATQSAPWTKHSILTSSPDGPVRFSSFMRLQIFAMDGRSTSRARTTVSANFA